MKHVDLSPVRRTSVTLRSSTVALLNSASLLLRSRGIDLSCQRLMRECLRLGLKFWRGRLSLARRNRRYNQRSGAYEIVPFYTSEALRAASWVRCHHSGMSLSRFLDFAIQCYLQRVVEYWLRFEFSDRDKSDAALWRARYEQRRHHSDFVISYEVQTQNNSAVSLSFSEKTEILPWPPPKKPIHLTPTAA